MDGCRRVATPPVIARAHHVFRLVFYAGVSWHYVVSETGFATHPASQTAERRVRPYACKSVTHRAAPRTDGLAPPHIHTDRQGGLHGRLRSGTRALVTFARGGHVPRSLPPCRPSPRNPWSAPWSACPCRPSLPSSGVFSPCVHSAGQARLPQGETPQRARTRETFVCRHSITTTSQSAALLERRYWLWGLDGQIRHRR